MASYSEVNDNQTVFFKYLLLWSTDEESNTGLQWHEGKLMLTGFSFLCESFLTHHYTGIKNVQGHNITQTWSIFCLWFKFHIAVHIGVRLGQLFSTCEWSEFRQGNPSLLLELYLLLRWYHHTSVYVRYITWRENSSLISPVRVLLLRDQQSATHHLMHPPHAFVSHPLPGERELYLPFAPHGISSYSQIMPLISHI